jgi:hypothetical protein
MMSVSREVVDQLDRHASMSEDGRRMLSFRLVGFLVRDDFEKLSDTPAR